MEQSFKYIFPVHLIPQGSSIVVYGALDMGKDYAKYACETNYCNILAIADKMYQRIMPLYQCSIISPEKIVEYDFDYILIASTNYHKEIHKYLLSIGIPCKKIKYACIRKPVLTASPVVRLYMDYFLSEKQNRPINPAFVSHPIHKILLRSLEQYSRSDLLNIVAATKQLIVDFQACNQYAFAWSFEDERYYYGHLSTLLSYSGLSHDGSNLSQYPEIQHGTFWYNTSNRYGYSPIVLGDCYQNKYHSSIGIEIGPMIRYAESLYPANELNAIKQHLGRVLLIFPSHSSLNWFSSRYNENQFVSWICKCGEKYDTILACLSFNDLNSEIASLCEKAGMKTVTAGVLSDQDFLSRLKSIMLLADTVVVNDPSATLNYAVAMNKEVVWYDSDVKRSGMGLVDPANFPDYQMPEFEEKKSALLKELKSAEPLSDSAKNCVKDLFRHEFFRSPLEISLIFEINKKIYTQAHGDKELFRKCTLAYLGELSADESKEGVLKYKLLNEAWKNKHP